MTKVIVPPACCQQKIALVRSGKATELHIGTDAIVFWLGNPIALISGDVVYHHITEPSGAITKLLNSLSVHRPSVALDAPAFDFTIGSLLTRVGLSLTRAPSQP